MKTDSKTPGRTKRMIVATLGSVSRNDSGVGMGGHQSHKMITDVWLTPPEIVSALGAFDLDPCSPAERLWDTAKNHYSDDGLSRPWNGRIWLNPPYGQELKKWLNKLVNHGDGIAIIFARTETKDWFNYVWGAADAILFIKGRLHFYRSDGTRAKANSGAPSALIAYGRNNVTALRESGIGGALVTAWNGPKVFSSLENLVSSVNLSMPDEYPTGMASALAKDMLDKGSAIIR